VIDLHLPDTDGPRLLPRCLRREAGLPRLPAFLCSADEGREACAPAPPSRRLQRLLEPSRSNPAPELLRGLAGAACPPAAAAAAMPQPSMSYRPEPPFKHGSAARVGVLLVNLGTPDAPTRAALRRYLAEFLSDPRVVEIPRIAVVADPARHHPAHAAGQVGAKYAAVWMPEGSPLAVWTARRPSCCAATWARPGTRCWCATPCATASRRIPAVLDALRAEGATRVLVLPLYPQYAAATTASVVRQAVMQWGSRRAGCPSCASCSSTTTTPATSARWPRSVRAHWQRDGRGPHAGAELPRRARAHAAAGRPLPLPVPQDGAAAGRGAGAGAGADTGHLPEPLRQGQVAEPYTEPTLQQLARRAWSAST
jgi:protoporphyrin/coproporphyrin ferrochelatase